MAYIGTQPKDVRSFGKAKFDFTATQGQTAFTGADDDGKTLGFTDGQINVYVNGILMDDSDYSTSGSNTVTLSSAANANDIISVVALQTDIPNSDYVPATGGTFTGDVTFDGSVLTKNENGGELQLLNNSGAVKGLIDFQDFDNDGEGQLRFLNLSTDDGGVQIGVAQSNSVGNISFVTDNQERVRIDPTGYTVVRNNMLIGEADTTLTYQGLSIRNMKDSGTANTTSFVDAQNNLATADAHMFFEHQTDGGSNIIFGTTPAGDRSTDRRVERMRINPAGNVTMPYQPYGYAVGTTNSTVAKSRLDIVNWLAQSTVQGGVTFSNGGRFTVPVAGTYLVTFSLYSYMNSGVSQHIATNLRKNGSQYAPFQWEYSGNTHAGRRDHSMTATFFVDCAANDYLDIIIYCDSGTNVDFFQGAGNNYFGVYLLG